MCVLVVQGEREGAKRDTVPSNHNISREHLLEMAYFQKNFVTWVHGDDPAAFRVQSQIGEDHSIFLFIKAPTQSFIFN